MNAQTKIVAGPVIHDDLIQGSDEWLQARCGLLTASEMRLVAKLEGGGSITQYRATGSVPEKLTTKRSQALDAIGGRVGAMRDLCFLAEVSEGVLRGLVTCGALEAVSVPVPITLKAWSDDRDLAHLYELLAQRVTQYVEPHYISDDMLRGHDDEVEAVNLYSKHHAPVTRCGFISNDKWGFTIGYSPDGLVGDEGLLECKSRRQKFQVQTIVEWASDGLAPVDYLMQCQTGMLVAERTWCDLISYSGGLPMQPMRIHADAVVQDAIVEAATKFETRLAEKLAVYERAITNLIPTERRVEQEMFA